MLLATRISCKALILFACFQEALSLSTTFSRRDVIDGMILIATSDGTDYFQTKAYGRQEYTNSITASRDTNLSPAEAYDIIRERIPPAATDSAKALDLGAGAGLSTAVLYREKSYKNIDAVDWSSLAWEGSVSQTPESVRFFELDDERFLAKTTDRYDAIVYNFAINPAKAILVAKRFLTDSGILLAPVNDKVDYWYKQSYLLIDHDGRVVWKSDPEVGAWSVQFQPDVTSSTCTGPWCGGFNGFR